MVHHRGGGSLDAVGVQAAVPKEVTAPILLALLRHLGVLT